MEKIAIFSDIHANIVALDAIIDDLKSKNIKKIYCLGDSVGKGPDPDLVFNKLKAICDVMILGNSDYAICKSALITANPWTANKLGPENLEYISNLPISYEFYLSGHLVRLFHASPYNLDDVYNPMYNNPVLAKSKKGERLYDPELLFHNTEFINKKSSDPVPDIVVYGHIHTPFIVRFKNKTLINTGSVGASTEMLNTDINEESNKFSTLASYIIMEGNLDSKDLNSISFQIVRVPYDLDKQLTRINESGYSYKEMLINTLKGALPTTN